MTRTTIILFFAFNQLCASEQINFLVLLPAELQYRIAFILWHPLRETDEELVERTINHRILLPEDAAFLKKHYHTSLKAPEFMGAYSIDNAHIYTTEWKMLKRKDEDGDVTTFCENYLVKIARVTDRPVITKSSALIDGVTFGTQCMTVSRNESQVALLKIEYYGDDEYCRNILKIVDLKTKTERVLPITPERISSIHFNKQSTKLIAYEAATPLKYHLISLTEPEVHALTVDMSLDAYFAQYGICKKLNTSIRD